ncbi:TPA: DNA cytosine methyltransferase [Yersinia enterocolitica]|nr:DNA cytosine methyltransferase [Yersinia enterocolitica]HEI6862793.1 DNA cytosine methyltransferase [Yersinia enterocolitica]
MSEQKEEQKRYKAIDLFAGAGGFSLAALNTNVDVLAAVEIDKYACQTYQHNIIKKYSPNTKLVSEDILKLNPSDFRHSVGLAEGELDLLLGGPPCQGFSSHRLNDQGINDPRNQLLIRYFDFVKELNPKIFLVENVPGLLWKRHETYLSTFKKLAKRNKYTLFPPVVLNSKDFGVPQNRNRVFILGIRNDIESNNIYWPPKQTHFNPDESIPAWRNASEVFEKPPLNVLSFLSDKLMPSTVNNLVFGNKIGEETIDPNAIHMNHSDSMIHRFQNTPVNGSRLDNPHVLECHQSHSGHKDVYGRIRLAQPGPTITTGCINPSKGRFLHPWLNHGITSRHAARLQSFPDDYIFSGGVTIQGKQIGNAVPVKLGEAVINEIKKVLILNNENDIYAKNEN